MDDLEKQVIDLKLRIAEMKIKLFPPKEHVKTHNPNDDIRAKLMGKKNER